LSSFNLASVLQALTLAGAASDAVASLVNTIAPLFSDEDQATLKEALADAQAENDEGHSRLQAKLAASSQE